MIRLIDILVFTSLGLIIQILAVDPLVNINQDYPKLKILHKPGNCQNHSDYPDTIQCAETGLCISFKKEFKNGKCDCCGPSKDCNTCSDQSDENRVNPPGGDVCKAHPHYAYGLTYQCAKNRSICLSRLVHWNNGQCDCCPNQNFQCGDANCTDHSDEECPPNEWAVKFDCDGNCIAISKYADNETDCWSDCTIEGNANARAGCEKSKAEKTTREVENFCNLMIQKGTPYFKCTTGDKQCVPCSSVRDKQKDCAGGEDEDATLHPDCSASLKTSKCDANVTQCVVVLNNPDNADCRCAALEGASITALQNCNKDRPQRRRRLF